MRTAIFYCPRVEKVTAFEEDTSTNPITVLTSVGHCAPHKNYQEQLKLIQAANGVRFAQYDPFDIIVGRYMKSRSVRIA